MGVPTPKRIRKRSDFQAVRSQGKSVFCKSFICQYRLFSQKQPVVHRLGVIASRKVGNAVKRNRGKRIIRELFHRHEDRFPSNCDIVVILRSNYANYSFEELESQFLNACSVISDKSRIWSIQEPVKCVKKTLSRIWRTRQWYFACGALSYRFLFAWCFCFFVFINGSFRRSSRFSSAHCAVAVSSLHALVMHTMRFHILGSGRDSGLLCGVFCVAIRGILVDLIPCTITIIQNRQVTGMASE